MVRFPLFSSWACVKWIHTDFTPGNDSIIKKPSMLKYLSDFCQGPLWTLVCSSHMTPGFSQLPFHSPVNTSTKPNQHAILVMQHLPDILATIRVPTVLGVCKTVLPQYPLHCAWSFHATQPASACLTMASLFNHELVLSSSVAPRPCQSLTSCLVHGDRCSLVPHQRKQTPLTSMALSSPNARQSGSALGTNMRRVLIYSLTPRGGLQQVSLSLQWSGLGPPQDWGHWLILRRMRRHSSI